MQGFTGVFPGLWSGPTIEELPPAAAPVAPSRLSVIEEEPMAAPVASQAAIVAPPAAPLKRARVGQTDADDSNVADLNYSLRESRSEVRRLVSELSTKDKTIEAKDRTIEALKAKIAKLMSVPSMYGLREELDSIIKSNDSPAVKKENLGVVMQKATTVEIDMHAAVYAAAEVIYNEAKAELQRLD